MGETMIPILPCRSIDETLDFYRALGFEVTFQQNEPNPFGEVQRGDIVLQFFGMKGYDPAESYSTCYIGTTDVDALYKAFRSSLKAAFGTVPISGLPRLGPLKDMAYGARQFLMNDPGGNTIRVGQPISDNFEHPPLPEGKFAKQLHLAVMFADSRGGQRDYRSAAAMLDRALASDMVPKPTELLQALVLRADMALRLDDRELAGQMLADARGLELSSDDRAAVRDDLRRADELAEIIAARAD